MEDNQNLRLDIRKDQFVARLLKRLPEDIRDSFTDEQLLRLKYALDMTAWGMHPIDLRGFFGIWKWKYYYVLLLGKDNRRNKRLESALRMGEAIFLSILAIIGIWVVLSILYLLS